MISFVILCHNEGEYLKNVIPNVEKALRYGDEIIILDDNSTDQLTVSILRETKHKVVRHSLNRDFSAHRNYAHQFCKNNWIFMVDADEVISDILSENIHDIILANPDVDLFGIPRLNVVDGMTDNDVKKWGWRPMKIEGFSELIINYPDFQWRVYRKADHIKWKGRLHEKIDGFLVSTELPTNPHFSLVHRKTIQRQTSQNEFYNKNFTENENKGITT